MELAQKGVNGILFPRTFDRNKAVDLTKNKKIVGPKFPQTV